LIPAINENNQFMGEILDAEVRSEWEKITLTLTIKDKS
jgi:hypothetical protein